jgi:putative flippase GtrA
MSVSLLDAPRSAPAALPMRVVRSLGVSTLTTILSASILVGLTVGLGVPAAVANVVAVCCGIAPSYAWNRRWVWGRDGRGSALREAAPFWALSIAALIASTVAVARVAAITAAWPTSWRALALPLANLAVYGSLWVVQFLLCDRVIFRSSPESML